MAADSTQLAVEVAQIAAMPGTLAQRAEALLTPLRRLTRFDAAFITLFDLQGQRAVPLVRHGYPVRVQEYLDSAGFLDDLERVGVRRNRRAMRLMDAPVAPADLPLWADYLEPAGFGEGIGVPLFNADGSMLGYVSVQAGDPRPAADEVCDLLTSLTPIISVAVDPIRNVAVLAKFVVEAFTGVVVTRAGGTVALPGLPGHRLLACGSPVLTEVMRRLSHDDGQTVFLCPNPNAADFVVRVTGLGCPPQPPDHLCAVVLLSPPGDLSGLTGRELEVLGLLVEGASNARIAAELFIGERTVAAHVGHILPKLRASSRTMAGVRAFRQGLFVPPRLRRTDVPAGEPAR